MPSPRPSSTRIAATAAAAAALLTVAAHSGVRAATLSEGFDTGLPAGWTVINLSSPVGTSSWFQGSGNPGGPVHYFDAYSGTPNSYVAAEFTAGAGAFADLSSWLITPTLGFNNCDRLSFFTRTYSNPAVWTRHTACIGGLSGKTSGAVAFRCFMPEGDPTGAHSLYIGIDSVRITPLSTPLSPPARAGLAEPAVFIGRVPWPSPMVTVATSKRPGRATGH